MKTRILLLTILAQFIVLSSVGQGFPKSCPAYPETNYFDPDCYMYVDEIQLGQATVRWPGLWGDSPRDLYIPSNKPEWAIASIHAWQVMRNTLKGEYYDKHTFLATAIKESFWNCDPTIDFTPLGLTYDITTNSQGNWSGAFQNDGCYHIAGGGKTYLRQYYPWRHTSGNHATNTEGNNFIRGAISKVHYDLLLVRFKEYSEGLDPLTVLRNAGDPFAADIWNAKAYNRGYNAADIESVMQDGNRAGSTANNDWLTLASLGYDYTETISHVCKVLSNQYTGGHPDNVWNSWYDHQIDWALMDWYIDEIHVMYNELSAADIAAVKTTVQAVFNAQDTDNDGFVSFRYEFGPVLDAFILAMPYDDPMSAVINTQSTEGGCAGCIGPVVTVWANGPTEVCEGIPVELETIVGSGYTYQWQRDGVDIANPNSEQHIFYATVSGSYSVDVTNASGCLVSAECPVDVTVNQCSNCNLTATPTGTPNSCTGVADGAISLALSGSSYDAGKSYTYEWTVDNQTTSTTSSTLPNITEGTYSIQVIDPDDANCTASTFISIEEENVMYYNLDLLDTEVDCDEHDLTADISGAPPATCTYNLGIYATNAGGDGKCWGAVWTTSESNPAIKINGVTAVNIPTVTQSALGNCMYDTMSITVTRGDVIEIAVIAKKQGGTVNLNNFEFQVTDPEGQLTNVPLSSYSSPQEHIVYTTTATCEQPASAFDFSWTPTSGLSTPIETDTSSEVTANISSHTTYTVEATSPDYPNCVLRDSVDLLYTCGGCTTPTNVQLSASNGGNTCAPGTITLTASAEPSNYSFNYEFYDQNGVVQAASSSNTFEASATGNYYVVVSDPVDAASCNDQSTNVAVTISSAPSVSVITSDLSYCGTGVDVEVSDISGANYTWTGAINGVMTDTDNILNSATEDTYSVEVVENGCTTTVSGIVVSSATPGTLTISGNASPSCGGTETYTATGGEPGSTYNWTLPNGASGTSTTSSIDITFGSTGGMITVQEDRGGGCVGTAATYEVTPASPSAVSISGNANPNCGGTETYTATGGQPGSTYLWTLPNGASGSSTSATIDITFGSSNGSITVQEDQGSGCLGEADELVINLVGCSLAADFESSEQNICAGDTVVFSNLSSGTSPSTSYAWDFGGGTSLTGTSSEGPHTVVFATDGNHTISLEITEGATINESKADYITVNPLPDAPILTGSTNICSGSTESYNVTNPLVGATYTWSNTSSASGSSTSETIDLIFDDNASTGTISAIVTANGCSATSSDLAVTLHDLPTLEISGGGSSCDGQPAEDVILTFTGEGPFDFTYAVDGQNTNGTSSSSSENLNNPAAGTYTPVAISDARCTGTQLLGSAAVVLGSLPTGNITSSDIEVCEGETLPPVTFEFTGTGSYTLVYNNGTSDITENVVGNNFQIDNPAAGTYTIVSLNDGCEATSFGGSTEVTINSVPTATLSGGGSICDGAPAPPIVFEFTGEAPWTIAYTVDNNPINDTTSDNPYLISNPNTGSYELASITDASGCSGSLSGGPISIQTSTLPSASITSSDFEFCAGTTASPVSITFTGTGTYDIVYNDGVQNHSESVTGNTHNIIPTSSGIFTLVSVNDGCEATDLSGSTEVTMLTAPTATISGGGTICNDGTSEANINFEFSGASPWTITYSNETTSEQLTTSNATESISTSTAGTYSITALSDGSICSGTDLEGIAVIDYVGLPSASLSAIPSEFCEDQPQTLAASGGSSYDWYLNGSYVETAAFISLESPDQSGEYYAEIDNGICNPELTRSSSVNITVSEAPVVDAGPDETIDVGTSAILSIVDQPITSTISWTPSESVSDATSAVTEATPGSTTTYLVQVTNGSCFDSDEIKITVLKALNVPTAFTPNGDGLNETWGIDGIDAYPDALLKVFNRWGNEVYQAQGYDNSWNGSLNGKKLPTGTYYWILDLGNAAQEQGVEPQMEGSVTIVR